MNRVLPILLLGLLVSPFPASACDLVDLCEAPPTRRYPSLARSIGITLDPGWVDEHIESIHESFKPGCKSFGKCLSVWGNPVDFCRLLFTIELRHECEKTFAMDEDLRGWQQCRAVADIFSMAQNRPADQAWSELQACAAEEAGDGGVPSPVISLDPPDPQPGVNVQAMVESFDPETGRPMWGLVTVDGTLVGPTFQRFSYVFRFAPEKDDLGRISMRPPTIVVSASPAPGSNAPPFAPVVERFDTLIPGTMLEFDPPSSNWRAGANEVRVVARDEASGVVLEGRILAPGKVLGEAGEILTIELRPGTPPCGEPAWFRPRKGNRPDTDLPIPPCG